MPKKFANQNTKAVIAKERKKAIKESEQIKKQIAEEDAKWKDNDKQILKKQQRKEDQEKKREQQLAKKAEAKKLLENEMNDIKIKKAPAAVTTKLTRSVIAITLESKKNDDKDKINEKKTVTHLETPLEENINHLTLEENIARNIDEALTVLDDSTQKMDKHPEKRMKALYAAFEEKRLNQLKLEYPSLRLSQWKQQIFKEWQKSPENPLNTPSN